MTDMKKILSNKYDAIFSSHSIEHIYTHEVDNVLKEFLRVLNEDGFLVITCPDMKAIANRIQICEHSFENFVIRQIYQKCRLNVLLLTS